MGEVMEQCSSATRRRIRTFPVLAVILAMLLATSVSAGDWHDFVNVDWRVDQNQIYHADNFLVTMAAGRVVTSEEPYASGWLAINLGSGGTASQFSQAGIVEQLGAFHWFVYSYVGGHCLTGIARSDGMTCDGLDNQYVGLNQTTLIQWAHMPDNNWYAFLYYPSGGGYQIVPLAMVYNQNPYIYRAYDGSESSSGGNTDGLAPSAFYFNHPQHTYPGGSTFVDWEGSDVNCPYLIDPNSPANCLYTEQDSNGEATGLQICPYCNGIINFLSDYRI